MKILSDDDIMSLLVGCDPSNRWTLVERTVYAVMSKLARGVNVKPDTSTYANYNDYPAYSVEAFSAALAAAQAAAEPRAYLTETDMGDMVWTPVDYLEACTYCDDDAAPIPLYAPQVPFATMTVNEDMGATFTGILSGSSLKPGDTFHLMRVPAPEGGMIDEPTTGA